MGKMQRAKGYRVERELVLYLRSINFEAKRVPLSGASEYAKHDVEVRVGGSVWTIEVKARKDAFKSIYAFYNAVQEHHYLAFSANNLCVQMSDNFVNVIRPNHVYPGLEYIKGAEDHNRAIQRFKTLDRLRSGASLLVIKDNNNPFLFIRF